MAKIKKASLNECMGCLEWHTASARTPTAPCSPTHQAEFTGFWRAEGARFSVVTGMEVLDEGKPLEVMTKWRKMGGKHTCNKFGGEGQETDVSGGHVTISGDLNNIRKHAKIPSRHPSS